MTHASLFSGIGGAEIAASWMGWQNLFHCEINPFGRRVLEYWYPNSVSYEDITKTDFSEWRGRVDVLTAGFPCQPFSVAGQRKGADDDRYLWPQVVRAVHEIRPAWVVGENVAGILTMVQPGEDVEVGSGSALFGEDYRKRVLLQQEYVIETVCCDLEREGYEVRPFVIPACAVGAPHRRDRVWIVARRIAAHPDEHRHTSCRPCEGTERSGRGYIPQQEEWGNTSQRPDRLPGLSRDASHASRAGWEKQHASPEPVGQGHPAGMCREELPADRWAGFPTQPPVCNGNDGLSLGLAGITFPKWRAEAIKALGNAWVPQVAYEIFRAIQQVEDEETIS